MELDRKPIILAVDDESAIRSAVQLILTRRHCDVYGAQNEEEAKSLVQSHAVDLILLDVKLGKTSGLDFLRYLREELKLQTPVLMMSGLADTERIKEASKYNIKGFLMKPFNSKSLDEKVFQALAANRAA